VNSIIKFKKNSFLSHYLLPISKVADNVSIIKQEDIFYTICTSQAGGSAVLYASYKAAECTDIKSNINIPDIKKFIRLLDCIEKDDIEIEIHGNHLRYKDDIFKFNYFLLEDGVMPRCPISPEKIKKFNYDSEFVLTVNKLQELLKGSSIATESDKIYISTKDTKVYAELNDFERHNVNNVCYQIADTYTGNDITVPIILGLESVRLLAGLKTHAFNVKINATLKIACIEYVDEYIDVKFIISGLVK
jgi:hypothetical protein